MRAEPSVLHLDLDAFFAAVEQRDKPSLRGKPVVVGGLGQRGVVSTCSYEARAFGIGSAMPMGQARALCPNAAFLGGRFDAYRAVSTVVMGLLHDLSPAIEPISLDEAFADLAAAEPGWSIERVRSVGAKLKVDVHAATGLTASVGAGTSKLIAKIASDLDKPDGLVVIEPGTEIALLHPMPVGMLWSVGPATAERLRRAGAHTVADLAAMDPVELVALLGQAHGRLLARLCNGQDDRPVSTNRESKSISVEDTFERDVVERAFLHETCDRMAATVTRRLRGAALSARTITVKIRRHDFAAHSRSHTLPGPTDDSRVVAATARRLLGEIDTTDGIRLLGVGVSGLVDWSQEDLFAADADPTTSPDENAPVPGSEAPAAPPRWVPGQDVRHAAHGDGWVQGSGVGRVTVRFETRYTGPGKIHTFAVDDADLRIRGAVLPDAGPTAAD